jgi:hypothetical protein
VPEVSSADSSSNSENAITREKSRSVELGRKEFPTWRVTLVFYRRRAFEQDGRVDAMLWRAFDKTV